MKFSEKGKNDFRQRKSKLFLYVKSIRSELKDLTLKIKRNLLAQYKSRYNRKSIHYRENPASFYLCVPK